jgi:hypothetical protein
MVMRRVVNALRAAAQVYETGAWVHFTGTSASKTLLPTPGIYMSTCG